MEVAIVLICCSLPAIVVATNNEGVVKTRHGGATRKGSLEELVYLELLRTTDLLSRRIAQVLKSQDLSSTQYNVLRILRGSPEGLPCGEIANRMITRDPDVTRLLDRLEKRSLIARRRDPNDRRTVLAQITREGLKLLGRLDEPILKMHREQLGHLGTQRLGELADILVQAREAVG